MRAVQETPEETTEQVASVLHGFEHDRLHSRCPGSDECELWYDAERRAGALSAAALPHLRVQETRLLQAMWEALGILGFDQDGDKTPEARLGQGVDAFVVQFLDDMRQERGDHDEALAEIPAPHPRPVVDREAVIEHVARRHWEHGQGGIWDRPADAPLAPFPAYATAQEKAQFRAYAEELLKGAPLALLPTEEGAGS